MSETSTATSRHSKTTVLMRVVGVLLLCGGLILGGVLAWQLWLGDMIWGNQQSDSARKISEEWRQTAPEPTVSTPEPIIEPVVRKEPGHGEVIGNLYIPRFGKDYVRTIAQGTSDDILSSFTLGIGHYDDTQMPGEVGNFVLASHRSAYGGGLHNIDKITAGDRIIVETKDGWYVYKYTSTEIVKPDAVEVLLPVPHKPDVAPTEATITLTTCNPLYSTKERIIAYGVLESFTPQSDEIPDNIKSLLGN